MTVEKFVVIKKLTHLEELLKVHATTSQVKFYLESEGGGSSFEEIQKQHEVYNSTLNKVISQLPQDISTQVIDKSNLIYFEAKIGDILIPVGDPGLVINCAKSANSQPVYAINSNPEIYDDVFTSSKLSDFSKGLGRVIKGEFEPISITMAQAQLDDGRVVLGVNDLFIGMENHVSARYSIRYDGFEENQSSSGIVISTGAGSTGWLKSILGNQYSNQKQKLPYKPFEWNSNSLYFAVREAFPSKNTYNHIVDGQVLRNKKLELISMMPRGGVIFADGMMDSGIEFSAGRKAVIGISDQKFNLVSFDKNDNKN